MRRSERYLAPQRALLLVSAFTLGCGHANDPYLRGTHPAGATVTATNGLGAVGLAPNRGKNRRTTGTTIVREAGARFGNLVARQNSHGIGLQVTQDRETKRIELVREGPNPNWHGCQEMRLVAPDHSLTVAGQYRASYPREGTVRESVRAQLQPKAMRMLAQRAALVVKLCGLELAVDESFRQAIADSRQRTIHASLKLADGLTMHLRAMPAEPVDETWLGLSVNSPNHQYSGCNVTILANGDALELPLFEYEPTREQDHYRGRISLNAVLEMAEAVRTVGALCERRFGLLESHQNQLRDFLMRFKEERSFANHPVQDASFPNQAAEGTLAL